MLAGFDLEKESVFTKLTHYDYLFHLEALTIHKNKEDAVNKNTQRTRKKA